MRLPVSAHLSIQNEVLTAAGCFPYHDRNLDRRAEAFVVM